MPKLTEKERQVLARRAHYSRKEMIAFEMNGGPEHSIAAAEKRYKTAEALLAADNAKRGKNGKKQVQPEKPELCLVAWVTVTVPVSLGFDGAVGFHEIQDAAAENFLDHPAIQNKTDLMEYIDSVRVEASVL